MTKLKTLITVLLLSSSAAAFAAPSPAYRDDAPIVRDHREVPVQQWKHRTQWTTLASSAKIIGTKEYIRVGAKAGTFDQLKLQTISGKTQIKKVQINFANGESQTVRLNTTLDKGNQIATIDLAGKDRAISSIIVFGSANARGSYAILAAS
jgi:hypothetical protein